MKRKKTSNTDAWNCFFFFIKSTDIAGLANNKNDLDVDLSYELCCVDCKHITQRTTSFNEKIFIEKLRERINIHLW